RDLAVRAGARHRALPRREPRDRDPRRRGPAPDPAPQAGVAGSAAHHRADPGRGRARRARPRRPRRGCLGVAAERRHTRDMRRVQEFVDRQVLVAFTTGTVQGLLEAVGDDGSLLIRQGRTPIWVPLGQVRYVTLAEEPGEPESLEEDESLT